MGDGNGTPRSWDILPSGGSSSLPRSWSILGSIPSWFKCVGRANSIRPYRGGDHGPSLSMILCRVSAPLNHRNGFSSLPHPTHIRKFRNANHAIPLPILQSPTYIQGYAAPDPAPSTKATPLMPQMSPEPDP